MYIRTCYPAISTGGKNAPGSGCANRVRPEYDYFLSWTPPSPLDQEYSEDGYYETKIHEVGAGGSRDKHSFWGVYCDDLDIISPPRVHDTFEDAKMMFIKSWSACFLEDIRAAPTNSKVLTILRDEGFLKDGQSPEETIAARLSELIENGRGCCGECDPTEIEYCDVQRYVFKIPNLVVYWKANQPYVKCVIQHLK